MKSNLLERLNTKEDPHHPTIKKISNFFKQMGPKPVRRSIFECMYDDDFPADDMVLAEEESISQKKLSLDSFRSSPLFQKQNDISNRSNMGSTSFGQSNANDISVNQHEEMVSIVSPVTNGYSTPTTRRLLDIRSKPYSDIKLQNIVFEPHPTTTTLLQKQNESTSLLISSGLNMHAKTTLTQHPTVPRVQDTFLSTESIGVHTPKQDKVVDDVETTNIIDKTNTTLFPFPLHDGQVLNGDYVAEVSTLPTMMPNMTYEPSSTGEPLTQKTCNETNVLVTGTQYHGDGFSTSCPGDFSTNSRIQLLQKQNMTSELTKNVFESDDTKQSITNPGLTETENGANATSLSHQTNISGSTNEGVVGHLDPDLDRCALKPYPKTDSEQLAIADDDSDVELVEKPANFQLSKLCTPATRRAHSLRSQSNNPYSTKQWMINFAQDDETLQGQQHTMTSPTPMETTSNFLSSTKCDINYHDAGFTIDDADADVNEVDDTQSNIPITNSKTDFWDAVQEKLGDEPIQGLDMVSRLQVGVLPGEEHHEESFVAAMQSTISNLKANYFNYLDAAMAKHAHGFPLSATNCYDWWKYESIMSSQPAKLDNTLLCLKKIVRIVATVNATFRDNLLELARPAGLFCFIVDTEVLKMFYAHYKSNNKVGCLINYILQLKLFIDGYWKCQSNTVMQKMCGGTNPFQVQNVVNQSILYLMGIHKQNKRIVKQERHVRQAIHVKIANCKIPPIEGYHKVLKAANDFLNKKYKFVLQYLEKTPNAIFNEHEGGLAQEVQNACWAIRDHFLFFSDAQRKGQYDFVLVEEFYLFVMKHLPDREDGRPMSQVVEQIPLNGFSVDIKQKEHHINEIQQLLKNQPMTYFLEIRRITKKIDKRQREKDRIWHRWNTCSTQQTLFIVHYFIVLMPKMKIISDDRKLPMTAIHAFHHTRDLYVLTGKQLFQNLASFYNYHAKKEGFATIQSSQVNATMWRHAFATAEMIKWENKESYLWCKLPEHVADEIAFRMNSSQQEVLSTYTTRFNRDEGRDDKMMQPMQFLLDKNSTIPTEINRKPTGLQVPDHMGSMMTCLPYASITGMVPGIVAKRRGQEPPPGKPQIVDLLFEDTDDEDDEEDNNTDMCRRNKKRFKSNDR